MNLIHIYFFYLNLAMLIHFFDDFKKYTFNILRLQRKVRAIAVSKLTVDARSV